jgi:NAD(P)-dependent dehydrogenase (short-subunit alcohol dehydrogenase family)
MSKTIAFIGASGGCGLAALKHAVAAGHTCIALCRNPAKLDVPFPERPANLIVRQGNAHSVDDMAACLTKPGQPTALVDVVSFTIGSVFDAAKWTVEDPTVCQKGMDALLKALNQLRTRAEDPAEGLPLISAISTTGISEHQNDVPLMFRPMYHYMLKVPHADKKVMEDMIQASPERWALVRPSFLIDGADKEKKRVRVGIENRKAGVEKKEVGYVIAREAVGRWIYENLLVSDNTSQYEGRAVSITW